MRSPHAFTAALPLAVLLLASCERAKPLLVAPATTGTARMTVTRVPCAAADSIALQVAWDASGAARGHQRYRYAVDPPDSPTTGAGWITTDQAQAVVRIADPARRPATASRPRGFHVFGLSAVDHPLAPGLPGRSVIWDTDFNIAPTVTIVNPSPSPLYSVHVPPNVRIDWKGVDPDGHMSTRPVRYKYLVLSPNWGFPMDKAIQNPDSLRRYYAEDWAAHGMSGPFEGWETVSGDTTYTYFSGLTPNTTYLFVVVGFDEVGDYNPDWSLSTNMVRITPVFPITGAGAITVTSPSFAFGFMSLDTVDSRAFAAAEGPADQPITFAWSLSPNLGSTVQGYRWTLDIADYRDQTWRSDEATDLAHWSQWSLATTSATIGPLPTPGFKKQDHLLYIQAQDNVGLRSTAVVSLTVSRAPLARPLLVVDDTRMPIETPSAGCLRVSGTWPNRAELDTFFFARGNVPWQCTSGNSEPGIFAGYSYDVFHTRTLGTDRTVPLTLLDQYRNVVWIVDGGVTASNPVGGAYSLRSMSGPGRVNTLAAYVRQGGRLWLTGGGGAYALCRGMYNMTSNDTYAFTYSNRMPSELQPGRTMYDVSHWQSELQYYPVASPQLKRSVRAVGGWNGQPAWGGTILSAPDYALLPATLDPKTPATDALPASRTVASQFYRSAGYPYSVEYLDQPNGILEDVDPDPVRVSAASTLDTLMKAQAVLAAGYRAFEAPGVIGTPVMTYYHGLECPQMVFTGFDLWNYQKAETVQLVDFVLQRIFGLTKSTGPTTRPAKASGVAARTWSPPHP